MNQLRIMAVVTQGTGSNDEARLRALLENFSADFFPFDHQAKWRSFFKLWQVLYRQRPDLVVLEGTGIAGGFAIILGRLLSSVPYVVSSGDAVGPFVANHYTTLSGLFALYERLLYRWSSGFIGWTPYLVGRALSFGAPRAMTAAGWAPFSRTEEELAADRLLV